VNGLLLFEGLAEAGYIEGRNVAIEYRWSRDQYDRLPVMAADLVRRQVDVIVALGIPSIAAAKAATTTIPIVSSGSLDPIAVGFIASLARPGGNITGTTTLGVELGPKRLELLHEFVPMATSIALLVDPNNPLSADAQSQDVLEAARKLGVQPHILQCEQRSGLRICFCEPPPPGSGGPGDQQQSNLRESDRTARRTGAPPRNPRDLPVSRIRRGRGADELRNRRS
jgi:putative tryptophan/tyrosine transport system substrate-binding protein